MLLYKVAFSDGFKVTVMASDIVNAIAAAQEFHVTDDDDVQVVSAVQGERFIQATRNYKLVQR